MPVARSHVQPTLDAARRAIDHFQRASRPVVAIGNEFRRGDAVMNSYVDTRAWKARRARVGTNGSRSPD